MEFYFTDRVFLFLFAVLFALSLLFSTDDNRI